MKKFFIFAGIAMITFIISFISFLIGTGSVDKKFIYDKGYVQGRLETEEGMRAAISACANEDINSMLDCLDKI